VWRSAGWPSHDGLELDLLAAGLVARCHDAQGHETLRVTQAGVVALACQHQANRERLHPHEHLVARVAQAQQAAGRLVWCGLSLRAQVQQPPREAAWVTTLPDVFSIRNTTVERYVEPVVHEIKVRRADLLSDLRRPAKREAYAAVAGEVWYVLGPQVGQADDVPPSCGVMHLPSWDAGSELEILRLAPKQAMPLPFGAWMALAKACPWPRPDGDGQTMF
jgi:hypothetical protein